MNTLKFTITLLFTGVLISCGEKKESTEATPKKPTETIKKAEKVSTKKEDFKKLVADLKTKTPATKEQFENWLPKTLIELSQTTSTINLIPGKSMCSAAYKNADKEITMTVIDGASNINPAYLEAYATYNIDDFNSEYSYGYDKATTIDGIKLREAYHKNEGGTYTITTFYNQRFSITLIAKKITYQELEQVIKELNLEHLKTL